MKKKSLSVTTFTLSLIFSACTTYTPASFSATPINLSHQPLSILKPFITPNKAFSASVRINQSSIKKLSTKTDFKHTTHVRIQEMYAGYPVWGSDAVIHIPEGNSPSLTELNTQKSSRTISMNGRFYQNLNEDLIDTQPIIFDVTQKEKALQKALDLFNSTNHLNHEISDNKTDLIVYVDQKHKAHWAYFISFFAKPTKGMPSLPTYIMDAQSFAVYEQWNDLKTDKTIVSGGGIGGNEGIIGKIIYDGGLNHFPSLKISRDNNNTCYLENALTIVKDVRSLAIPTFSCEQRSTEHNNVYWNTLNDAANGGYSPENDALYSDTIVRQMYQDWFKIKMLVAENGTDDLQVTMNVHDPKQGQNAFYYNGSMTFGEGDNESYPVVAPSVVAHEMSHGFTIQNSNLIYRGESGSLNESFSDMADKAVQYYVKHENNWIIDDELLKTGGRPLRFMDEPEKDGMSIGNFKQYQALLKRCKNNSSCVVHYASGIYNKAFVILSQKWDTKKAFELMTLANRFYWTSNVTFHDAACLLIKAAQDNNYNTMDVTSALNQVGINTSDC